MAHVAIICGLCVIALGVTRRITYAYQHTLGIPTVCLSEDHCGCPACDPDDTDSIDDDNDRMFTARSVHEQIEERLEILRSEGDKDPLLEDCRDVLERLMWTPSTAAQRRACDRRAFGWMLLGVDNDGHYWMPAPHLEPTAHECVRCHRVTLDWLSASV